MRGGRHGTARTRVRKQRASRRAACCACFLRYFRIRCLLLIIMPTPLSFLCRFTRTLHKFLHMDMVVHQGKEGLLQQKKYMGPKGA